MKHRKQNRKGRFLTRWRELILLCAVAPTAGASGCATTKPWQREHLATAVMAPDGNDPDRVALSSHLLGIREGAVGGFGGGGGGCGCN